MPEKLPLRLAAPWSLPSPRLMELVPPGAWLPRRPENVPAAELEAKYGLILYKIDNGAAVRSQAAASSTCAWRRHRQAKLHTVLDVLASW